MIYLGNIKEYVASKEDMDKVFVQAEKAGYKRQPYSKQQPLQLVFTKGDKRSILIALISGNIKGC